MPKSCPECGAEVQYAARTVELQEATCAACGHASVLAGPSAALSDRERSATAVAAPAAPCWECGSALTFSVLPDRRISSTCPHCETTSVWVLAEDAEDGDEGSEGEEDDEESEEEDRPAPRAPRGPERRFDRSPRGDGPRGRFASDRPPPRPCRQCGGAISFRMNPDGTRTGTCASCGNEFTMRPRESGFRSDRGGRSFGRDRRPGGSYGGGRPPYRGRRRDDDDDDDRPRRRRPRSY